MIAAVFARGTTPTHTYTIAYSQEMIQKCSITYRQKGKNIITKRKEECQMKDNTITVQLSQEETLLFSAGEALVQIKVLLNDGRVESSEEERLRVLDTFDEEVF